LLVAILAAYYYLRIIIMMFQKADDTTPIALAWPPLLLGVIAFIALIALSVYPGLLVNAIKV